MNSGMQRVVALHRFGMDGWGLQVLEFFLKVLKAVGVDFDNPIVPTIAAAVGASYLG